MAESLGIYRLVDFRKFLGNSKEKRGLLIGATICHPEYENGHAHYPDYDPCFQAIISNT